MVKRPHKRAQPTGDDLNITVMDYRAGDGLLLSGFCCFPRRKPTPKRGILFVHGTRGNALVGAGFLGPFLAQSGYMSFCIDKRNSGINYETSLFDESIHDLQGGIDALATMGMREIILVGHSLGAIEVAFYMSQRQDPRVRAVVLSGTPADTSSSTVSSIRTEDGLSKQTVYARLVDDARALVKVGEANRPMVIGTTGDGNYMTISAESFLSYRGPETNCRAVKWVGSIKVPILLLAHEITHLGVSPSESAAIKELIQGSGRVDMSTVSGADHFYSGREREAAETVRKWLESIGLPP